MTTPIISVEGLGKAYFLGRQVDKNLTLRDTIAGWGKGIVRHIKTRTGDASASDEAFWALKDATFNVNQGEVVGFVGRNGAGKSTLLKLLSRITEPSKGRAVLRGRVASLLEVGTGFHPELTGRENIFLNGAILGMRRAEIQRKFDEIVAFSECEKFLDTPVKRYSSGMYVRLAFAVAATSPIFPRHLRWNSASPTASTSSTTRISGSRCAATANARRTLMPVLYRFTGVSRNSPMPANSTISSKWRVIACRLIPSTEPLR